ncbi:transducin beta-like protein 2 [Tanacetum coccineum]
MLGNSRANSIDDAEGLVKIIAEKEIDKDIARMCHAHPTLSEAVKEAVIVLMSKRTEWTASSACDDGVVRVFKFDDASSKSFKFMRINMSAGGRPTAVAFANDDASVVVAAQSLTGVSLYM